jgi:hypothetical protein
MFKFDFFNEILFNQIYLFFLNQFRLVHTKTCVSKIFLSNLFIYLPIITIDLVYYQNIIVVDSKLLFVFNH